nr:p48 [Norovirus GII]
MKMASNDAATATAGTTSSNSEIHNKDVSNTQNIFANMTVGIKRALGARPKQPPPKPPSTKKEDKTTLPPIPPPPPNGEDIVITYNKQDDKVSGVPIVSTVETSPLHDTAYSVPPLDQREKVDAKEPLTGSILEMWDGEIYHYGLYVEKGLVLGVHKPPSALSLARIELTPLSLYWRTVYTPPYLVAPDTLKKLHGESFPYTAFDNNCYTFCCWVLDLNDSWLNRKCVSRTTGFYRPYQDWNRKPLPTMDESKLKKVANVFLCGLSSLFTRPIKDLVGRLKPLNILNIVTNCDWTFPGVVEALILLAELFGIFWTPPDISAFVASLLGDYEMQ